MANSLSSFVRRSSSFTARLLVASCLGAALLAAPVVMEEKKFSIELPAGWEPVDPGTPEIALARQSADKQKSVRVAVLEVPPDELVSSSRVMVEGMKQAMTRSGHVISAERDEAMAGLFFHTVVARGGLSKTAVGYVTSGGGRVYGIQLHSNQTEAVNDSELQGIITSFRLLGSSQPGATPAVRIGTDMGQKLLLFGLVGAAMVLGAGAWLVLRKKRPRKRRRSRR